MGVRRLWFARPGARCGRRALATHQGEPAPPAPPEPPARARAFQAVADQQLSRDDALKFCPELRPASNELVVAQLKNANDPAPVNALRESLQAVLNAGEVPQPQRAGPQLAMQQERSR